MARRDKDNDGNPGFLPPEPKIKASNKKVLALVLIVVAAMLMLMMFGMSEEKEKPAEEAQAIPIAETESKPLTAPVEGFGLAFEENSTPPPPEEKDEEVIVVGPPPVDREAEARLREAEETRRRQFASEQEAYGAPMLVKRVVNNQPETGAEPGYAAERPDIETPAIPGGPDAYNPAAARDRENFLERADNSQWVLPYRREAGHEYELKTGAVIPGTMVGGINSDLPGSIIGQVSQNVYDTATGRALLIPRGARLYGVYDSRVVYGQQRVLIAWNRLIFPDGSSVTLGAMPGADVSGYAGFSDKIDNHYFRIFGSAVLMSLIGGGMSYAVDSVSGNSTDTETDQTTMQDEMTSALAAQLGQTTLQLLQKNLNLSPTLEIRPGYQFNIMVTKDVIFGGPYAAR